MPEITWDSVLERRLEFLGGEFLIEEDGILFRGPISDLRRFSNFVEISFEWCACFLDGRWVASRAERRFANVGLTSPQDIGGGRIRYDKPMLGHGILSPSGTGGTLSRESVEGFENSLV